MGENPKNVFNYGAPGIDNILRETLMTQEELSQDLEWDVSQNFILFTYHPVTIHHRSPKEDIQIILEGVRRLNMRVLFTYANADNGGSLINQMLEKFALQDPNKYKVVKSLGRVRYLSALKYSKILLGNSSSGIIEAASFCKPVVNIGDRQKGRIKGENVLDCQLDSVFETISYGVSDEFMEICNTQSNIYGDGNAAKRIVGKIASSNVSTRKEFFDLT